MWQGNNPFFTRQSDRHMGRHTNKQANKQANKQTNKQTSKQGKAYNDKHGARKIRRIAPAPRSARVVPRQAVRRHKVNIPFTGTIPPPGVGRGSNHVSTPTTIRFTICFQRVDSDCIPPSGKVTLETTKLLLL